MLPWRWWMRLHHLRRHRRCDKAESGSRKGLYSHFRFGVLSAWVPQTVIFPAMPSETAPSGVHYSNEMVVMPTSCMQVYTHGHKCDRPTHCTLIQWQQLYVAGLRVWSCVCVCCCFCCCCCCCCCCLRKSGIFFFFFFFFLFYFIFYFVYCLCVIVSCFAVVL